MGDFTDACGGGVRLNIRNELHTPFILYFDINTPYVIKKKNIHIVCIEIPGGAKTLKIFFMISKLN